MNGEALAILLTIFSVITKVSVIDFFKHVRSTWIECTLRIVFSINKVIYFSEA